MLFPGPLQCFSRPLGGPDCKKLSLDHHSGYQSFKFFFFGDGGGGTGSCVAWAGFTLTVWLRVTLNSQPPGPRVKPPILGGRSLKLS